MRLLTMFGRMYRSFSFGLPLFWDITSVSCLTRSSFSRSSASRVLNRFCTSLMRRNAVFRLDDGAAISPGSFELVER
uniref:Putative secreted protein n=1 Tax=Anopheles darlingi TaxID=43151 RepID=A0A2M4D990_ANODA